MKLKKLFCVNHLDFNQMTKISKVIFLGCEYLRQIWIFIMTKNIYTYNTKNQVENSIWYNRFQ
jgi:hypothetical protein